MLAAHLDKGAEAGLNHVSRYMDCLRALRREAFRADVEGLAAGSAVVNPPGEFMGYADNVLAGMAAGRPVISWEIRKRPRTLGLFRDGEEILLFPKDDGEALRRLVERTVREPGFARRIAANAMRRVWRFHTTERRVRQVLDWIESGKEPEYGSSDVPLHPDRALAAFTELLGGPQTAAGTMQDESPSSRALGGEDVLLGELRKAEKFLSGGDMGSAIAIIEAAAEGNPEHPGVHATLAEMYRSAGMLGKAELAYLRAIQLDSQNLSLWMACAKVCIENGNAPMAQAALEGALSLDASHAEASMLLKELQSGSSPAPSASSLSAARKSATGSKVPGREEQDRFYEEFFLRSPEYSSPHPNSEEAARWEKIHLFLRKAHADWMSSTGGSRRMRILDLGCGRGWLTNLASQYGECEGIDPVAGVVEGAKRLFPQFRFHAGEAQDLRRQPDFRPFNLVINSEVIEHVPWADKNGFVDSIKSLLAPGGWVILTTPRGEVFDEYMRIVNYKRQPIEDWSTEAQTRELFEARGFRAEGPERIWIRFPDCAYFQSPGPDEVKAMSLMSIYQIWRFRLA
jgi:SAM-dependent methyltransferase